MNHPTTVSPLANLPFTLTSLRQAYAEEGYHPSQIITEMYRRLRELNDPGIFIHLMDEADALKLAESLGEFDPRQILWGIPFAVKDNIDVAGMPTTAACPTYEYAPAEDAHVVACLRAAGAIPVGKTNLDQFATGLVGVRSPFPHPRNAIDPALVPGGSSSGSAVSVAQGLLPFALGTDTAGSGRVPAALNNLVGLKPTLGAISNRGVVPACRSLDSVSIFALNINDAMTVLSVANHYDAADAYTRSLTLPAISSPLPNPAIGVPDIASLRFFGDTLQADAFEATLTQLEAEGARLERINFTPFYQVADLLYHGAWIAERTLVIDDLLTTTPDAIHPVTRQIIQPGQKLTAMDAFKGLYQLQALKKTCRTILKRFDYLCVPSIPTFYTTADLEADPIGPNNRLGTYTNFVNLLDLCALTVPCPPRSDGRPGSVTFIGTQGKDSLLATEGQRLEAWARISPGNTGWPYQSAPTPTATATNDELILAVCGAHMSGLPLNHELTCRGGRFIERTKTAPHYKLFALSGGPPYRPGLVRQESEGVAVALELWALPKTAVGDFISGIPSPLGIGTVVLSDQRTVKGFVCEASGLNGAEDISALGCWRAFLQSA
ncbi:allophanate hydrolase [Nitrincola sp. MINF-07-Sa-05]|uniref:allophanate hydrolase n=1 Tax=Nitrincola salilacus TaxID=3400273 RepID=UPI003918569C